MGVAVSVGNFSTRPPKDFLTLNSGDGQEADDNYILFVADRITTLFIRKYQLCMQVSKKPNGLLL